MQETEKSLLGFNDVDNATSYGVNFSVSGGKLTINGKAVGGNAVPYNASNESAYSTMPLGPFPAGTYSICAYGLVGQSTSDRIVFSARYSDNTAVVSAQRITGAVNAIPDGTGRPVTFTATQAFKVGFYCNIQEGSDINSTVKVTMVEGNEVYNYSDVWSALVSSDSATLETIAIINGTTYTAISDPRIERSLMNSGVSVGNCTSASLQISVQDATNIPKSETVEIQMRYVADGARTQWVSAGTFYVSKRSTDPITGVTSFTCYDAMMRSSAVYPAGPILTDENGVVVTDEEMVQVTGKYSWPRAVSTLISDIASMLGVTVDSRNYYGNPAATGYPLTIAYPGDNSDLATILGKIGAQFGGNWFISHDNKLRFIPLRSSAGASSHTSSNGIDTIAVLGTMGNAETMTITGIRYRNDKGDYVIRGSNTGIVLTCNATFDTYNSAADRASVNWMYNLVIGRTYQQYTLTNAIYDPAVELGDFVCAYPEDHDVESILANETVTLGLSFRGDISAPDPGEMEDEFPYISAKLAALGYANTAELRAYAAAQDAIQNFDNSLTQQEVYDRLTGNGVSRGMILSEPTASLGAETPKQIYFDGSYLDRGIIRDRSGLNYWILDDSEHSGDLVTQYGRIGGFTVKDNRLSSSVTSQNGHKSNSEISQYGISYSHYYPDEGNPGLPYEGHTLGVLVEGGAVRYLWDDEDIASIGIQDGNFGIGNPSMPEAIRVIEGADMVRFQANDIACFGNMVVYGSLTALGTKSRGVEAGQYGNRLLYAYETPTPLFGDVGEGTISDDGYCYVWLDPVFAQTVNTDQYQVFLQPYASGECWVEERRPACFIVRGEPGMEFGWEIKAKQADYSQKRLDNASSVQPPKTANYGDMAIKHLHEIQKARETK